MQHQENDGGCSLFDAVADLTASRQADRAAKLTSPARDFHT
ncbi:hypothetical protein [Arthrobacter sp. ZGTC212]|nr:hypothetical protein [Arthrobacter sp. ZGTC212]